MTGARVKVLRAGDGEVLGPPEHVQDRFLLAAAETGGRVSLVEHLVPPRTLIAPMHRHTREDEFSFVLEGTVGAVSDGTEVVAEVGDLLWKPRDQWHTFWNAGDTPVRILEIISPGGLEELFRRMDVEGYPDEAVLAEWAAEHGIDLDPAGTEDVLRRHSLTF